MIAEIQIVIQKSELGVNPNNNENLFRFIFHTQNNDRRKKIVKLTNKISKEVKVIVRHQRGDLIESLKKDQKEGTFSEDKSKSLQEEVQKLTDKCTNKIDGLFNENENEFRYFLFKVTL